MLPPVPQHELQQFQPPHPPPQQPAKAPAIQTAKNIFQIAIMTASLQARSIGGSRIGRWRSVAKDGAAADGSDWSTGGATRRETRPADAAGAAIAAQIAKSDVVGDVACRVRARAAHGVGRRKDTVARDARLEQFLCHCAKIIAGSRRRESGR